MKYSSIVGLSAHNARRYIHRLVVVHSEDIINKFGEQTLYFGHPEKEPQLFSKGARRGPEVSDLWDKCRDVFNEMTTSTREIVISAALEQHVRLVLDQDPAQTAETPSARDEGTITKNLNSKCVGRHKETSERLPVGRDRWI